MPNLEEILGRLRGRYESKEDEKQEKASFSIIDGIYIPYIVVDEEEMEQERGDIARATEEGFEVSFQNEVEKTCYVCGGSLFWISKYNGRLYCATCHPPADPSIVAGWRGKKQEPEKIEEIKEEAVKIDYQKLICKWCKVGKFLGCLDCEDVF